MTNEQYKILIESDDPSCIRGLDNRNIIVPIRRPDGHIVKEEGVIVVEPVKGDSKHVLVTILATTVYGEKSISGKIRLRPLDISRIQKSDESECLYFDVPFVDV